MKRWQIEQELDFLRHKIMFDIRPDLDIAKIEINKIKRQVAKKKGIKENEKAKTETNSS